MSGEKLHIDQQVFAADEGNPTNKQAEQKGNRDAPRVGNIVSVAQVHIDPGNAKAADHPCQ